jgi:VWFA-related protein
MKRVALVFGTLGVSTIALVGQQAAVPPQTAPPLFRTGVDYVRVDVIVTDRNDRPVEGLTKDEFVITENNRAQTILDFQHISIPVTHRTIDVKAPVEPEPDVATNTPPSPSSRLFVLVIDDLHILESEIVQIKSLMLDFVKAISPDDEVAVVFVGRSDLSQNFTTNTGRLLATIDRVRAALGFGIDAMAVTERAAGVGGGVLGAGRSAAFVLKNVATSLAGSGHARRAIVYVSGGNPLDPHADPRSGEYFAYKTLKDELDDAFDQARRSDVPIYTLDPRGLMTPDKAVRGWLTKEAEVRRRIGIQQDYLATVAINTGGRALLNRSDMTKAVDEIVGENGSYYLLGYSPDPAVHDGKYHPIDVKVTRPGLIVRPRAGYVAAASGPATTDAKPALDKAMSAGVNVAGLSLRAFAAPVVPTDKGMTTVVTIELTYPAPVGGASRIDDTLQTNVLALDADGKVKTSSGRALQFASTVPEGAATVTVLINDTITLPSQPLTLRIGTASQALGTAGTVQFSIDVPKPSDSKLQWGGVAIGFADFGRQAALRGDAIKTLVPFQPTTTRSFKATDTLRVFGRLFWGSKDAAADVTLTIADAAGRAPQVLSVPGAPAAGNASRHEGTLTTLVPLRGLAVGTYTLRVEARLASGQVARKDVAFEVW